MKQYDDDAEKYGYEGEMGTMKCDELAWNWVYIPYLDKPEIQRESAIKAGYSKVCFKSEVDAAIAELKEAWRSEHDACESLKQKLEDVQASAYAESVDAGMENRRLKRALWLARTERANEHYHRYHGKFLCPLEDIPEYVKWKQVERKCRAKAEQYK